MTQHLRSLSVCRLSSNIPLHALSSLSLLVKASGLRALPSGNVAIKHGFHLLKRLTSGLGIGEKCVDGHDDTECAEDHVCLPLDVGEGGRYEEG